MGTAIKTVIAAKVLLILFSIEACAFSYHDFPIPSLKMSALQLSQQSTSELCASIGFLMFNESLQESFAGDFLALHPAMPLTKSLLKNKSVPRCLVNAKIDSNVAPNSIFQVPAESQDNFSDGERYRGYGEPINIQDETKACFFQCEYVVYEFFSEENNVGMYVIVILKLPDRNCPAAPAVPKTFKGKQIFGNRGQPLRCFYEQKLVRTLSKRLLLKATSTDSTIGDLPLRSVLQKHNSLSSSLRVAVNKGDRLCQLYIDFLWGSSGLQFDKWNTTILPNEDRLTFMRRYRRRYRIPVKRCVFRIENNAFVAQHVLTERDDRLLCGFNCDYITYNISSLDSNSKFTRFVDIGQNTHCKLKDFNECRERYYLGITPSLFKLPVAAHFNLSTPKNDRKLAVDMALRRLRKKAGFANYARKNFIIRSQKIRDKKYKVIIWFKHIPEI